MNYETELVDIIHNSKNPAETLSYALNLIFDFLPKREESQCTTPSNHQAMT